eukprot:CAMPEP_0201509932 /NCGR_PEP_ID=MMETSP0161_2-20130828/2836_1 /ASSEMBLY_ACC=CAM_ASM_000251 /TAXON_ID=180227 /ORGANISM="Neoparamoeba aestuarina, Strain SoJaBio B1-5/56/2" /LENGTH=371 /DNA_ID=CAMNT_0047905031 /DNA_START=22 /DNA_END=1137 /DNA_ORIENTATION=-
MAQVDSIVLERIRKQIEFYFSDSNFRDDKFLRGEAAKNEGFVEVKVLGSFNRVKQLTTDDSVIVRALKDSSSLILSEDEKMVKRADPLPEEDSSLPRCIYVKRFPLDTTLEQLEEFFSQYGKVNCIRMRKQEPLKSKGKSAGPAIPRPFKGSVIVEFAEEESAKKMLEMKDLVYKAEEKEEKKEEKKEKEKEEKEEDKKEENGEKEEEKKEEPLFYVPEAWNGPLEIVSKEQFLKEKEEQEKRSRKPKQDAGQKRKESYPKGCIVAISGYGDEVDRFKVKEVFEAQGHAVSFVELTDDNSGFVRMNSEEATKETLDKLKEQKTELGGKVPEYKILEGDEEANYWQKITSGSAKGRGRGRGRGRGGRGRGRK